MRTARGLTGIVLGTALTLAAPGCVDSAAKSSDVQIWGRITHKGTPLKGGVVIFAPGGSYTADSGVGVIEDDGTYKVVPSNASQILAPGRYKLFIEPPTSQRKPKHFQVRGADSEEVNYEDKMLTLAILFPVPKRFRSLDTSNLWVMIENEPNRVDIDLPD